MLYAGDSIQDGRIFMFGPMRNLVAYRQSLEKIMRLAEKFDLIYPCHASLPVTNEIIPRLMEGGRPYFARRGCFYANLNARHTGSRLRRGRRHVSLRQPAG